MYAQMSVTVLKISSLWGSLQLTEPKKRKEKKESCSLLKSKGAVNVMAILGSVCGDETKEERKLE